MYLSLFTLALIAQQAGLLESYTPPLDRLYSPEGSLK